MFVMHIWSSSVLAATSSRIAPQCCESSLLSQYQVQEYPEVSKNEQEVDSMLMLLRSVCWKWFLRKA